MKWKPVSVNRDDRESASNGLQSRLSLWDWPASVLSKQVSPLHSQNLHGLSYVPALNKQTHNPYLSSDTPIYCPKTRTASNCQRCTSHRCCSSYGPQARTAPSHQAQCTVRHRGGCGTRPLDAGCCSTFCSASRFPCGWHRGCSR